jgi:RHS repeat-associated protein
MRTVERCEPRSLTSRTGAAAAERPADLGRNDAHLCGRALTADDLARDDRPSTGSGRRAASVMSGARYDDPLLSRFTTADSVSDRGPQGLNRYSYALNNPIRIVTRRGIFLFMYILKVPDMLGYKSMKRIMIQTLYPHLGFNEMKKET